MQAKGRWIKPVSLLVGLLICGLLAGCTQYGATLERPGDPVVLQGSALPRLLGTDPAHVVGFSWGNGAWHQIPLQVDQRDWVPAGQILGEPAAAWPRLSDGSVYKLLVYTAPHSPAPGYGYSNTYTGSSSSPTLAAQDEVSFLADNAGVSAPSGSAPPGVTASSAQRVSITDPLHPNDFGYVYLYSSTTLTGGGAGTTGVRYSFSLDSGDYRSTYKMGALASPPNNVSGFNPEHSTISTPDYSQSYGDRWLNNGLTIQTGTASGAPLLERGRIQVVGYGCGRSEDTFDGSVTNPYEGAFITNISGPVRAIRSYMGANSGPYTATTDIFYPQREDSVGDLRVHSIPGVMTFDDFVTGTSGLTYSDDQNSGIKIDGVPDAISATHFPAWQMVSGPPGSLVTIHRVNTSITGLAPSTLYLDQNPAVPHPCTGDAAAWGQSGAVATGPGGAVLPCTDPVSCPAAATLQVLRYRYFEPPGQSSAQAAELAAQATTPLQTTVSIPTPAGAAHAARDRPVQLTGFIPSRAARRLLRRFSIVVSARALSTNGNSVILYATLPGRQVPVDIGKFHVLRRRLTDPHHPRILLARVLIGRRAAAAIDRAVSAHVVSADEAIGELSVRPR